MPTTPPSLATGAAAYQARHHRPTVATTTWTVTDLTDPRALGRCRYAAQHGNPSARLALHQHTASKATPASTQPVSRTAPTPPAGATVTTAPHTFGGTT